MSELFEQIYAKDENTARQAVFRVFNECNTVEFNKLCEKMDYLFDFVRENVYKRFSSVINSSNYKNIIKFFGEYSPYFDDFFASELAKYANEDLTDEILEILENGTESQKTYASSYFKKIPDTVAEEYLKNNLSSEFEPLFVNSAEALGKMESKEIYEKYKSDLKSDDEFVILNAVKFFTAYNNKDIINDLIDVMSNSGMSENIAGEIVSIISPFDLLNKDFSKGTLLLNNLINGLGEILPLENVFYYEIYELVQFLFKNTDKPEAVMLLFNLKNKFDILTQNDEYIFDLDKNTKNEIYEIKNLLFSKDKNFWNSQKNKLKSFLNEENIYLSTVLEIIKNEKFTDFADDTAKLAYSKNETLVCEIGSALKELNALDKIDKSKIIIQNPNLKAIFEQFYK